MMQHEPFATLIRRMRLSSREIAVAVALTVLAAAFLVTALFDGKQGDGSSVVVVERVPQ